MTPDSSSAVPGSGLPPELPGAADRAAGGRAIAQHGHSRIPAPSVAHISEGVLGIYPVRWPCLFCREPLRFEQHHGWVHPDGELIRVRPDGRDDHLGIPDRRSGETRDMVKRQRGRKKRRRRPVDQWHLAWYSWQDSLAREQLTQGMWRAGKAPYSEVAAAREVTARAQQALEAVERDE